MASATTYWDPQHKMVVLKEGVLDKEGDAYGYLNDTLSSTGWSVLEIRAGYGKTPEPDEVTLFLAGYLEGFLTARWVPARYVSQGGSFRVADRRHSSLINFCARLISQADDGSLCQHVATTHPQPRDPRPGPDFHGVSISYFHVKELEGTAPAWF